MRRLEISDIGQADWARLAGGFDDANLMQCWEYGEAKARTGPWRVERGVFLDGGKTVGMVQVLIRPLPILGGGLAWINRGPLWRSREDAGPEGLVAMLGQLGAHYAGQRGMYLRLAPMAPEGFIGSGALAPEGFKDSGALAPVGLRPAGAPGWASAVLDLSPTVEDLRQGLRQKWRNGLNRAERQGLEIRQGAGDDLYRIFLDGHVWMMKVKGIATTVTPELLGVLRSLYLGGGGLETIAAFDRGTAVATALMVRYGDTVEYLAGNTSDEGRKTGAGQLVLWRAVTSMKEQGCRRFDLGGLDEALTPPGIRRFKEGLGGVPYRLAAELESTGGGLRAHLVRWRVARSRAAA